MCFTAKAGCQKTADDTNTFGSRKICQKEVLRETFKKTLTHRGKNPFPPTPVFISRAK